MAFDLEEAVSYYKRQGAPGDQSALIALLREIQESHSGGIPAVLVTEAAGLLGTKETLLLALIRRIPSLRLSQKHLLELCAGPNCPKKGNLAAIAEKYRSSRVDIKYVPCMRLCGKGPNLRWDGKVYNGADEALIRHLLEEA
ncbi:MAG: formate dehydrogenase [Oscillospiraceae bacterium]|nr:formate dehydrogenase [Oscillospiraceae bacterium]